MTPNYDVSGYLRAKFHLTPAQIEFIERNPHLSPCDTLPDGDVLCLDRQSTDDKQFGPYILTRDCKVQSVDYHYTRYH